MGRSWLGGCCIGIGMGIGMGMGIGTCIGIWPNCASIGPDEGIFTGFGPFKIDNNVSRFPGAEEGIPACG